MPRMPDLPVALPERLRLLVETGIALSSELSLGALLKKLVETAAELTGARYGALGVIDPAGTGLEQFITVGVDAETRAIIGDLPRGRGILGVLIRDREPLRLADISQDPRSVGFPPGHPPMGSFLGVPVRLRGTVFGNLYLTEKEDGEGFTEEDEEVVRLLAAQAAVAIENARLYESASHWSRQLESLNEVSAALVSEPDLGQLLALAASRLRDLLDARIVLIQRPSADGADLVVETACGENADRLLGLRLSRERSKSGRALTRRRSERVDTLIDDPEVDQTAPRLVQATSGLFVPLIVHDKAIGIIVAYDKRGTDPRFSDADQRVAEAFANRAAIALELSERVGRESVRALLEGQELERRRLARELHDETGQALASILLGLKALEKQVGEEALAEIRELVASALGDVRRLTVELRPPALDDFGLEAALERLATVVGERSGVEVHLNVAPSAQLLTAEHGDGALPDRPGSAHEHRQARRCPVGQHRHRPDRGARPRGHRGRRRRLRARERPRGALGLVGMRERVHLMGGRFEVQSAPGQGTTLVAELPLDS